MKRRTLLQSAPLLLAPALLPGQAGAQQFPAKPLRYIVPVAAGGGSDMIGRNLCERLSRVLGQTLVVEDRKSVV